MTISGMGRTGAHQLRKTFARKVTSLVCVLAAMLVWLSLAAGASAQSSITITTPSGGSTVAPGGNLQIAGTSVGLPVNTGVFVIWNGTTYGGILVQSNGSWSITLPPSALGGLSGAYPIGATSTGPGQVQVKDEIFVAVGPGVPATPVISSPASSGPHGPITALSGTAGPMHTVIVRNASNLEIGRTMSLPGGEWAIVLTSVLGTGTHNLRVWSQDWGGALSFPREVSYEVVGSPTAGSFSMSVPFNSSGSSATAATTGVVSSISIASNPAHGTATVSGLDVNYVPTPGYSGADSFTYTATGPGGTSVAGTVSVTVATQSHTGAQDQAITITPGTTPAPVDLTVGATNGPFSGATIGAVSPPEAGTARLEASGGRYLLHFSPNPYFVGTSTVPFTLTGPLGTGSAKVVFTHVRNDAVLSQLVEQRVAGFISTRSASLAALINRPTLSNRFGSGPGTINLTPNGNSVALNFASSTGQLGAWSAAANAAEALAAPDTRFNAWIDGNLTTLHMRNDGKEKSWGRLAMISVGGDYLVDERLLLGMALHGDFMVDEDKFSKIGGSGFIIGPYVSMEVSDGLFLDAEIYYGRSWNDVTAGLFQGTFETQRLMSKVKLEGEVALSDSHVLRPQASLFYLREQAEAYVISDGLGASLTMPGMLADQVRLAVGGRLEQSMTLGDDLSVTPFAGAQLGLALGSGESAFTTLSAGFAVSGMGTVSLGNELVLNLDTAGLAALTARARIAAKF